MENIWIYINYVNLKKTYNEMSRKWVFYYFKINENEEANTYTGKTYIYIYITTIQFFQFQEITDGMTVEFKLGLC